MKKHDSIHANHRVQRDYPAKVRFCPLCGAAMGFAHGAAGERERKVCTQCGFVLSRDPSWSPDAW